MSEEPGQKTKIKIGILNKSIVSLFVIILLLGYGANYFLISFLQSYLAKFLLDAGLIAAVTNFYYLIM